MNDNDFGLPLPVCNIHFFITVLAKAELAYLVLRQIILFGHAKLFFLRRFLGLGGRNVITIGIHPQSAGFKIQVIAPPWLHPDGSIFHILPLFFRRQAHVVFPRFTSSGRHVSHGVTVISTELFTIQCQDSQNWVKKRTKEVNLRVLPSQFVTKV